MKTVEYGLREGKPEDWPVGAKGVFCLDQHMNGWISDGTVWRLYTTQQPCMHCGKSPYSEIDPATLRWAQGLQGDE